MSTTEEALYDNRVPTASDLAFLVKVLRQASEWTQETLAELSGLTVRTIQRVEKGESANAHTRLALARGFGYEDLDVFNKPWPILNPDKLKAHAEELERTTVVLPLTLVEKATTARQAVEGAESSASEVIGDVSDQAREAFAYLVDNLRDYNDIRECYGEREKLEFDQTLQEFVDTIAEQKAAVGVGIRKVRVRFSPDKDALPWTNIYFILGPSETMPAQIRIPKKFEIA